MMKLKTRYSAVLFGILLTLLFNTGCSISLEDDIDEKEKTPTDSTISLLAISGVTAPVIGMTPVTSLDTTQYTGTIKWSPTVTDKFIANSVYTATITLTPKAGYTLTGIVANSFTVDGSSSVIHSTNSGVVTVIFPSTSAATITLFEIPGVNIPTTGEIAVNNLITSQYTGTVSWSPAVNNTFEGGTTYTALIALSPNNGYTLTGVKANSFVISGATTTHSDNSGVVTAVFPSTSITSITLMNIPGVVAPVPGAAPVTIIGDNTQYSGSVSWSPEVSYFMGNTVYTATITLSPKVGYTLNGVALNNFVVAGAVVTPTANAGVITATFPSTPARKISQSLIPGVMAPVTGNSPVTTVGGSDQYTGVVNWSPTVVGTFTANTVYTANITLIPKDGYTLTGVGKNSFMVAGLDGDYIYLIHAANSGSLIVNYVVTASQVSTKIGNLMAIPAGRFQRDSSATNISVITQPYTMSQHEITRGQFMNMFLNNDPSNKVNSNGTSDPVQMVNWYHAIAFCNKLSLAEGLTPVYVVNGVNFNTLTFSNIPTIDDPLWNTVTANWTNNGYRLPTEMEWLWAAMGAPTDGQGTGINTTGYLKGYAGSIEGADHTQIASYAWYESNSSNRTHAVGGLDPNELGLYDMSGNVYEWCWDWSADYPVGTLTDYRCSVANTNRVIKGGGWSNASADFRLFIRSASNPYAQANSLGFRVVRL